MVRNEVPTALGLASCRLLTCRVLRTQPSRAILMQNFTYAQFNKKGISIATFIIVERVYRI
jgi:hypothetical protein